MASICQTNLIQICSDGFARGYNQITLCDLVQMLKYDNFILFRIFSLFYSHTAPLEVHNSSRQQQKLKLSLIFSSSFFTNLHVLPELKSIAQNFFTSITLFCHGNLSSFPFFICVFAKLLMLWE